MFRRFLSLSLLLSVCAPGAAAGEAREPVTGLLGAMGSEVRLLLEKLEGTQERKIEGIRFWTGRLRGRRVAIAMTGVGKVNAATTTTLFYQHFRPAEVVFTGIAGGLNPELKPGDIVIATKTAQHDFGTLYSDGFQRKGARNPITHDRNPLFLEADPRLLKAALAARKRVKLGSIRTSQGERKPRVVEGIVVTGDQFIASPAKRKELRKELEADAVEMEGAAVAQVCWQWQVPCLVIRSLSDLADDDAKITAQQFLHVAARNSATLVTEIVGQLRAATPATP